MFLTLKQSGIQIINKRVGSLRMVHWCFETLSRKNFNSTALAVTHIPPPPGADGLGRKQFGPSRSVHRTGARQQHRVVYDGRKGRRIGI